MHKNYIKTHEKISYINFIIIRVRIVLACDKI